MKNHRVHNKCDQDMVVCIGTDIPPLNTVELMILGRMLEFMEQKQTNILTMNDIFLEHTYKKKERFDLISNLVKKKVIQRNKIDSIRHEYIIIPKMTYRDSKEIRIYRPKTRHERLNLKREFAMAN